MTAPARVGMGDQPDFDLFDKLGATDEQLDFPVVYASALNGFAKLDMAEESTDMAAV